MRKWLLVFGVLLIARSTLAQPDNGPGMVAPDPQAQAPRQAVGVTVDGPREALNKANHPIGKLDLSSPENTVRSFVWALTNGELANARACVFEPLSEDKLRPLQQLWERDKPALRFLISDFHSYQDGERATVTLRLTDILSIRSGQIHATCERVHLRRTDGKWLIIPDGKATVEELKTAQAEDILVMMARMLADEKVFPLFQDNASLSTCQANLKQIGLAIMMFLPDWDEKFDLHEEWQKQLQPYLRTNAVFLCPGVPPNETSYVFNKELEDKRIGFPKPHQIIMVYEGKDKNFAYRHQNNTLTNIAFADGHIKAYTKEALDDELKAGTVRWTP